jgi:hypothetical protein
MRTTTIAPPGRLLVSRPDDARNAATALAGGAAARLSPSGSAA